MKQIICMNWGTAYGADYVNRLYSMVSRNLQGPFRLVCLTDNTDGIRQEVECHPCPEIDLPSPQRNRGWRKINLWGPQVPGLEPGPALFLDLDIVITDSIDALFAYEPQEDFIVIHNWTQPNKKIGNTSVYRFRVGSHAYLLENLIRDQKKYMAQYSNSQTYISENVSRIVFWPEEWCRSFKVHCIPKGLNRYFQEPTLPQGTKIVAFPGLPNPPDAAMGVWPAPWYKRIYKQFRPATWVQKHWQ